MTAKDKAKELLDKMSSQTYSYQPYAGAHYNIEEIGDEAGKKCALIAVDEIIKQLVPIEKAPNNKSAFQYWEEVKQELELL